jgi:hypothetical protein
MEPPLPRIESAVPRTLHAQLEIAKAVRTLTAPNRDDPLRQRRAEIAAIRQDLEALAREIPRAFKEASALVKIELRAVQMTARAMFAVRPYATPRPVQIRPRTPRMAAAM